MKLKTFILTFLMMSCSIVFGQGTYSESAKTEAQIMMHLANDEVGTITIANNISIGNTIEILNGRKVTIDLNGHELSTNEEIYIFKNFGKLTITDSDPEGKGTIIAPLGIYNGKPQTRTISTDINYNAQLTINGGKFVSTSSNVSAAIYNHLGVINIRGGEFYGEYSAITNYGMANIENTYIECLNRDNGAAAIINDFEIEYGENVRIVGRYTTATETGVITPSDYEPTYLFAELNGTKYPSLQAALDACTTGDNTINLLFHNSDNATVSQKEGVNITIDGNGYKGKQFEYTGTIYINGNSRHTGTETLTIQDVNFVTTDNEHDFISCNDGGNSVIRYAHNVTVQDCNFTATEESTAVVALRFRQSYNINVVGGTFTNLHSVMWATGTSNATVDGITATNCKEGGISFGTSTPVYVKNSTIAGAQYGVRADGSGDYRLTVESSELTAEVPVIVRNTTGEYNLTVKEDATLASTNNGPQVVVTKGSDNADYVVPTSDVNVTLYDNVTSTFGLTAKIGNAFYATLQDAVDNAKDDETVTLIADNCKEDVTVTQAPDYAITIDGAEKTFKGTITVDGKSTRYETTALTIKNVNFDATEGITYDACIRLGNGTNATRYTNKVTVESCTFTDNDYSSVAVKSYTGGDWNLVVKDCEANGMHSLAQLANVEKGLVISGNTANTKNGINLNQTAVGTIEGNIINVKGYAVRAGVDGSNGGNITLNENTLKTDNTEGDPVIELRGTVVALNMEKNVVSGNTHIKGTAGTISVDANYWDGKEAPVVAEGSAPIVVNSYYSDKDLTNLVRNEMGSIYAFVSSDRIFGDVTTNAEESIKIEIIGKDGNVIGTSSLENLSYATGFNKQLTWRINLGDDDSDSWLMAWNTGAPSINNMPTKVKLYVDAKEGDAAVAEAEIKYTANGDGQSPVFAAKTNANGKINSFIACTGEFNLNKANTFLKEALTAGDNVAITVAGTYAVPTGKDLTITGAVDGVVFDNNGAANMGGANVTFNKVTFDYYPNVNYTGLQHSGNLVYNNCIINGQVFLYGTSETFNNCTFNQNSSDAYNVWTYGAKEVAFNECTFNSAGKSVLIYSEDKNLFNDVAVTKCTFKATSSVDGKAAIEMDSSLTRGINLTIDGETTANGFDEGNASGNTLWNNKKGNDVDANNDITVKVAGVTVLEPIYVAKIGEEGHRTLQEAINKVENGETITLLADCDEEVTFTQTKDVSFVLDGNDKTYTGSINITARAGLDATSTLVIKNFNFKTDKTSYDFIKSVETNYYPNNITITGCSFEGTSDINTEGYAVVAVRMKSANNLVIKDCTGTGLHSFLQNTAGWNLTIDNVKVNNAAEGGLALGTVQGVTVKNCEFNSGRYGIRLDGQLNNNAVIESNKINAFIPVVVRKASHDGTITFNGTNEFTQSNTDGYWCVIGTEEYKTDGALPSAATAKINVTLSDAGLDRNGIYGNYGVAKINNAVYNTFADALNAVQDGETITVLNVEGSESSKEIEFTKDIEFTITGTAPKYALPVVTFQNATVNIKDAEILIPELDARQEAIINVIDSKVYDAGGNSIAKSYYNGAINISGTSEVYMMQVTTMGYINISGTAKLHATWQTNVYGNGLVTIKDNATFNTAALHLTAQDYSNRDNTDAERADKPAEILVDGANLTVGKVLSSNNADYSYNSSHGINVGTKEGKSAILNIKNGGKVNIYMANGETTNFGAGATVNVDASTLNTICRAENGTVTLANNGTVNVTGAASINIKNLTGNAINFTDVTIADAYIGGRVNAFGTNNFSGETNVTGILSLGYETNPTEQVIVNVTGKFNGTNVIIRTNNNVDNILNVGSAEGERTTAHFGQLGASADVNIVNSDVTYGYAFVRNDFNVTNSTMEIKGGVNTYFAGDAKVVLDNTTWNLPGYANIGSYGTYMYGNADITLKNSSVMKGTSLGIEVSGDYEVKVTIEDNSRLEATKLTNQGSIVLANVDAKVTSNEFDNAPTTSVAYHKVNYVEGSYVVVAKDYVAQIYDVNNNTNDDRRYETLAEAATAAQDGETIQLLWNEGDAPISMAATFVGNKTVTITGTADVDWSKGWFFVGRGGEGNGHVIFDNANLTSTSVGSNSGLGLNVSCKKVKEGEYTTNDGEVEIINSNIQLDYLIGKGNIKLDNSTLNVYEGFAVGARPASETGEVQRTVTMDITNGSNVIVKNHNGQGLGYESMGIMNIDATSSFETTQAFLITADGTMNVNGGNVKVAGTLTNNGTVYVTGAANLDATVTGDGWFYMNGVTLDADTKLIGAKVGFINGENNIVASTIKDGWFSVGIGKNTDAETAAAFATANGITLGSVTVNVSDNATVYTSTDAAYSGWVGSAYSAADKGVNKYILNINNSLARFGYMHVSKDGEMNVTGKTNNKYEYAGNAVDFYAGTFINNGNVTLNGVDAWAQYTKISVDHADAVLNITNGTKYEANCTTGNVNASTFLYHKAGTVNVDATSSVNIEKATTLVEGAVLNIASNKVIAKGAFTGNGTINFTSETATLTVPTTGLTVNNETGNNDIKVVYENGTYKFIDKHYVAEIDGGAKYETLAEAIEAVEDGGTITLIANETFTENNRYNNGGWWDGLGYSGDKSFTIDLANFTISQDGALNDYLMWFKNDGAKDNTITLKNGTLDAGTTAYCALATASSNAKKITVNLENIQLINNNSNGAVLKIRGGAELNVKAGTVITGEDSYVGIECYGATVNIYDGAEIYQNGTTSFWGCLVGVSNNGEVNVYGGKGTSAKGGFIAMTSGGTINVEGGEWIANTDGTYANDNNAVLIAQSDKQYNAGAGNSIVNVSGGVFKGGYNCYGNAVGDAQINISGGIFSVEPSVGFIVDNYGVFPYDENSWVVREISGEQTFELIAGWNWVSSYITEFNDNGLAMLQNGLGTYGIQIKNDDYTSTYRNNNWSGRLESVSVEEMYKVNMNGDVNFKFEGGFVNYDECKIVLYPGWNYIGYPVNVETNLADALVILSADGQEESNGAKEGDVIKSQLGSATYIGSSTWLFTNSFNLVPGEGYMYYNTSDEVKFLRYTTKKATTTSETNTRSNNHWTVDATQYPSNMTMIAMTDVEGGNYEVAAFVNGEVRGSSRPVYVESLDAYILILTISGDDVEEMTFKCYDLTTGEEVEFSNRINYSNDAIVGSANEPYMLTRGTTGIGEAAMSNVNIYPNPTTTGTEINLQATCDKVEVFNALGVKVVEYQNVDSIDALETAGIYVIRITNNGNVQNCRLVVK